METVTHPIPPRFDASSRILILGSFPSVKSREGLFFYHHPQNRFWKVLAGVLEEPVPGSIEEKKIFLLKHRIALWDVIASCTIEGSSDSTIKMWSPTTFPGSFQPQISPGSSATEALPSNIIKNTRSPGPAGQPSAFPPPARPTPQCVCRT